ncbi:MAG: polysaccharide deacetylase family protein [Nocardioidaceae bacterium]
MSALLRAGATVGAVAVGATWGPALTSLAPLRRSLLPGLAGISDKPHIALTYDDGPDPASTPHFLTLLEQYGRRATFFVLGAYVEKNAGLVREMSQRGHELAVHGWDHRCLVRKRPGVLTDELRRTAGVVEELTERPVRWFRPAYGVLTTEGLLAARSTALRTVLWSAWGRDWTSSATASSVQRTVTDRLALGGTVLLHDTDRTSSPGSWRHTLAASRALLDDWSRRGVAVGPLVDHW